MFKLCKGSAFACFLCFRFSLFSSAAILQTSFLFWPESAVPLPCPSLCTLNSLLFRTACAAFGDATHVAHSSTLFATVAKARWQMNLHKRRCGCRESEIARAVGWQLRIRPLSRRRRGMRSIVANLSKRKRFEVQLYAKLIEHLGSVVSRRIKQLHIDKGNMGMHPEYF